jgi:uncharacterized NAD(P)/FAD-binding protein YdhS
VFEKQDVFGPGFPHSEKNAMPFHLINMCAQDMGIIADKPEDFQNWADNHQKVIQNKINSNAFFNGSDLLKDHCEYYPRSVMGEYLKSRFEESIRKARQLGLQLDLYPRCEVIDLLEGSSRVRLTVKNLNSGKRFSTDADRVLIATGHWFEREGQDHYFPSPWPAKNLTTGIPQGESVAIIGTSLSALDAALALAADGEFVRDDHGGLVYLPSSNPRKIRLYSRQGLLPKIRGKMGEYKNKFLTLENVERLTIENDGILHLNTLFQLLESDLVAAYGHPIDWAKILSPPGSPVELLRGYLVDAKRGDGTNGALLWQTVLNQTFPLVRRLYTNLPTEDRERFDKKYNTLFFSYASPMPLINGEELMALMESGTVHVVKLGNDYQIVKDDSRGCYDFVYKNHLGVQKRDSYNYVIDARGQEKSFETNTSELAQNLLRSGTVQIEELPYFDHRKAHNGESNDDHEKQFRTYRTGSVWIDPETHHVLRKGSTGNKTVSDRIYAVGAMTRGQIIDASMAYAGAVSTAKIAEELTDLLKKTQSSR